MGNDDKIYTVKQAAERLRRTERAVWHLIQKGKLNKFPQPDARVMIAESELRRFLGTAAATRAASIPA